jgi:hypothetical protein
LCSRRAVIYEAKILIRIPLKRKAAMLSVHSFIYGHTA